MTDRQIAIIGTLVLSILGIMIYRQGKSNQRSLIPTRSTAFGVRG